MSTPEKASPASVFHLANGQDLKHLISNHIHFPKFDHEKHAPVVNVNVATSERLTVGQKVADVVAANMGSWRFIIIQSIILVVWIVMNAVQLFFKPFDPYPFILLNLALSFQAAFAAPFIMISQNRQAEKDRLTAQNDYQTDCKGEEEIRHIMEHLDHQDKLIIQIVRHIEEQNRKMENQHQSMLAVLDSINPEVAQNLQEQMSKQRLQTEQTGV